MIARAAASKASGLALAASSPSTRSDLAGIERLANHAGRGDDRRRPRGNRRPGGGFRRELHRLAPAFAGKGIGIAGIDHERACHAVLKPLAAPIDRRRRSLGLGEHAGDAGSRLEQREQEVGAALDSGCRPRRWRSARPQWPGRAAVTSVRMARSCPSLGLEIAGLTHCWPSASAWLLVSSGVGRIALTAASSIDFLISGSTISILAASCSP